MASGLHHRPSRNDRIQKAFCPVGGGNVHVQRDTDISIPADIRNPVIFHNHHRPQKPCPHLHQQLLKQRRIRRVRRRHTPAHQEPALLLCQRTGKLQRLSSFFLFQFQRYPLRTSIVNPDTEFLPRIRSRGILHKAPVIIIIEVQTPDAVHSGILHVTVQRNQMLQPAFYQHPIGLGNYIFQFMTIFLFCLLHCCFSPSLPQSSP